MEEHNTECEGDTTTTLSTKSEENAPESGNNKDETPPLQEWTTEAESGSEQSQLDLGLYYLKLADSDIDRQSNGDKAMKWLIEASKQGNEEATAKLRHCLVTGFEISEERKEELVWCMNTSAAEKKVRNASRKMFSMLNPSQSNLSQEQYLDAINKLPLLDDRQRKLMNATVKKIGSSITENDFVGILSKKIQGTLTLSSSDVDDSSADYKSSGYFRRVFVYPKETASDVMDRSLEFASKEGMNIILSFVPTGQIYLLLSIFLYSFLTVGVVLLVVPLIAFYMSTAIMVVTTLQMFYKRRKKKDSDNLASMLQQFDTGLDLNSTASQYSWNSLTPYLVFFSSLLVMVISFSLANKTYIPTAGIFVTSIVMTMFCFYALSDSHDIVTLTTLVAHFFASLPVYLAGLPPIPLLKYIYSPFVTLSMGYGFVFNVSLPAIVYMIIPVLLARMAMKENWSGIYKIVIPHLVCYFWFSISTAVYPFCTVFDIAKVTLCYLFLPLIFPLLSFFVVCFIIYKLIFIDTMGKIAVTCMFLTVPLALSKTKLFLGEKKLSPQMVKVKKGVMVGFAILAIVPLLFIHTNFTQPSKLQYIEWADYKQLCIPEEGVIVAKYQKDCHDFQGMKVQWSGTLEQIQITGVENNVETLVKALPGFLSFPVSCLYGKPLDDCDRRNMTERQFKKCKILEDAGHYCHLNEYDQYSFSVKVKVDDVSVALDAGSCFERKLMALEPGDKVNFVGKLKSTGTASPGLKMKSIDSTTRTLGDMDDGKEIDEEFIMELMQEAVEVAVNFAFFPVVSYTPE